MLHPFENHDSENSQMQNIKHNKRRTYGFSLGHIKRDLSIDDDNRKNTEIEEVKTEIPRKKPCWC